LMIASIFFTSAPFLRGDARGGTGFATDVPTAGQPARRAECRFAVARLFKL